MFIRTMNTGAVTNVGVTPAAKPFDIMVGERIYIRGSGSEV